MNSLKETRTIYLFTLSFNFISIFVPGAIATFSKEKLHNGFMGSTIISTKSICIVVIGVPNKYTVIQLKSGQSTDRIVVTIGSSECKGIVH